MFRRALRIAALGVLIAAAVAVAIVLYIQRSREVSGIWLYQFEGSNFFEGATQSTVRSYDISEAAYLPYDEFPQLSEGLNHGFDPSDSCWNVTAFELKFVGRQILGPSGHLSSKWSRFEIEELLEARQLDWPACDSPYFDWGRAEFD